MAAGDVYTIHVEVQAKQIDGADVEWEDAAQMVTGLLTTSVTMAQPRAHFEISAELDTAEDT